MWWPGEYMTLIQTTDALQQLPKHCHREIESSCGLAFFFFFFFGLFRAISTAFGGSQARGRIGAVTACLRHSHSHVGSEPCLQPTPQLMVMPGSLTHWMMSGIKPTTSWMLVGIVNHWAMAGIPKSLYNLLQTKHLDFYVKFNMY